MQVKIINSYWFEPGRIKSREMCRIKLYFQEEHSVKGAKTACSRLRITSLCGVKLRVFWKSIEG